MAQLIVKRRGLSPPIDVVSILEEYAQVELVDWPYDLDGLTVSIADNPRVFIRKTPGSFRERFTAAHELGHIVVPWHFDRIGCKSRGEADLTLQSYSQEDEADVFASSLLVPDEWLDGIIASDPSNMTGILDALGSAQVSVPAALVALRPKLLAGWIFGTNGENDAWWSPGTKYPTYDPHLILRHARENCTQSGYSDIAGRRVTWYRMTEQASLPPVDSESRTTSQLLRDAIATLPADSETRLYLSRSANGKVGGAFSRISGRDETENYATLLYRFSQNSDFLPLLSNGNFILWLARKARDKARQVS